MGLRLLSSVFALLLAAATAGGQADTSAIGKTLAGRRALDWVGAVNAGSDSVVRTFLKANLSPEGYSDTPIEERLTRYRRFHDRLAPIVVERQLEQAGRTVKLLVRTKGDQRQVFTLTLEPEAPNGIAQFGFSDQPAAPGAGDRRRQ